MLAFVEKPPPGEAPTDLINAGTYVLEPSVLDRIPLGQRSSIEREVFPAMVADGALFAADDGGVYWADTGTPEQYLQVMLDVIAGRRAIVAPPAVAADAVVAPDAELDDAIVMTGVVVGAAARVTRAAPSFPAPTSAPAPRSATPSSAPGLASGPGPKVLAGSVIGGGIHVPEGSVIERRRIPEPEQ